MADTETTMRVRRIYSDEDGSSYLEPPVDENWPPLDRLRWRAAVVFEDHNITVTIHGAFDESFGDPLPGEYEIRGERLKVGPLGFTRVADFLNGMSAGAALAQANGTGDGS